MLRRLRNGHKIFCPTAIEYDTRSLKESALMDVLPDVPATLARWLDWPVPALLLAARAGFLGAAFGVGTSIRERGVRRGQERDRRGGPRSRARRRLADAARAGPLSASSRRTLPGAGACPSRQRHRRPDRADGRGRARDREELVQLQEELEADHRIGLEKARLIRSFEACVAAEPQAGSPGRSQPRDGSGSRCRRCRRRSAHAKRAQASTEERLARLRGQLREQCRAGSHRRGARPSG